MAFDPTSAVSQGLGGVFNYTQAPASPSSLVANPYIQQPAPPPGTPPGPWINGGVPDVRESVGHVTNVVSGPPDQSKDALWTNPAYQTPAQQSGLGGAPLPDLHSPQMQDPHPRTPEYGMNTGGWGFDGSQAGSQFQTSRDNGNSWQQSNPQTQDNPWTKPGRWGQSDNGAAPGDYTRK